MAGPGGGPPRKSHTKSRKGCRTCKKRHIRCDETFPQCRNCTKHSVRCDYMDMPVAGEEPMKGSKPPDLLMSPELQKMLDNWRLSGEPPLPELHTGDPSYWTRFSTIDLRLIHHITTSSLDLCRRGYASCTAWAPKMLNLISVALASDFAMNALLALSASHLAWQTKNTDTENLAYHHRGVAIKGLHEAIGAFSERNSEAILAASMLLSWQATEWRSWASLQQGVSTVMNAMRPWMHKSELANFLESQRALARAKAPTTPSITGLPAQPPAQEDLRRLDQISTALHNLRLRLSNHDELVGHVDDLIEYLQRLQEEFPLQAPDQAFERLLHLRSLLFWLPPALLRPGESDLGAISMLSHFFALALVLEPLFPEIGGAYLGNLSVEPIEKMHEILQLRRNSMPHDNSLQVGLSLLETPVQIATAYRANRRVISPRADGYHYSPQPQASPFLAQTMTLGSTPDVSRHNSYGTSPLQSPPSLHSQGSYFSAMSNTNSSRRDSSTLRSQGEPRIGAASPLGQVPYAVPGAGGMDYFGQSQQYQDPYGGIGGIQQNRAPLMSHSSSSSTNYSAGPNQNPTVQRRYPQYPPQTREPNNQDQNWQ